MCEQVLCLFTEYGERGEQNFQSFTFKLPLLAWRQNHAACVQLISRDA